MATFESSLKPRLIYVFAIADSQHEGSLKIGETTLGDVGAALPEPNSEVLNLAARARIAQYTRTAGISYELLHTELTIYVRGGRICSFNDKQVHSVLERSGVKRKECAGATEWYCCDLATVKRAIGAIKEGKESLGVGEVSQRHSPIVLRPEQKEAVERTLKQFRRGKRMLWNAKMRFGKTLCALRVAREMEATRTIIITHRPVVDASWFEDFGKTFHDRPNWHYGSHSKGEHFDALEQRAMRGDGRYVYFASMQDMRGSQEVGGKFDKNNAVFSTSWDLVIVDEAHEGTQTELGRAVLAQLIGDETKVLRLSGTPFNLLDEHKEEEVFTWDYVMEQRAKKDWELNHLGDANPYASLPAIHIYTYDLGSLMSEYGDEEKAFNFREFFCTREDGAFVHERDIDRFLSLLTTDDEESLYPYSNDAFREIFRHTLWILPGVKAAKALSRRLSEHPVFGLFKVVNVAGDGDEEEESRNALELVNQAIGPDPDATYTITLSCGRLTTGVSVRPWTGVFMMAGSYSTSAAGYMQTIFRVQTPYTHNGRMKTDCYAFDFAPDRTLRMLAEAAKVSRRAGKQSEEDRKILGDFLNFCPIIAIDGGQMKRYRVETLLAQLKRAQIERVVQDGFENEALYNDELLKLTEVEIKEFDALKGIIGRTKAMPKLGNIEINRQGLTNGQYEERERLEMKRQRDLMPEEKKRLDELRAKADQRRGAISILRGISIRMPLMLYGAEMVDEDRELTIDNFANLVDDASWQEFMPRGVTKEVFCRFKRYYDADIFREAGKRIREMARMADKFTIEERIARLSNLFATFRHPDKETVLTPWRVVNMHLGDSLGGYCFMNEDFSAPLESPRYVEHEGITPEVFHPRSVILEINSKSGLYPLYATYSIYRARVAEMREKYGEPNRAMSLMLWDKALEENIFVVCKTPMARYITLRTLRGFRDTVVHAEYYPDLIEHITTDPDSVVSTLSGRRFWKLSKERKMTIDAIIGNPPYQVVVEGNGRAKPVYHLFIDLASMLAPRVSLITPARYLFNAGFTPTAWNHKILNDPHFKIVLYKANSTELFPSVDIKGGVAIMYKDTTKKFGKIGTFTAYPELDHIADKVASLQQQSLVEIIYAESSYRFDTSKPEVEQLVTKRLGSDRKIISNIFDKLPDLFTEEKRLGVIGFYGRTRRKRCIRYAERFLFEEHPNLDKYKVIVPESNGSGAIGEVLSTPLIGEPLIGATQTFLTIGAFDTRAEAEACLKYVKTKFARTMLSILKVTQHNPKETWQLVPLQDFTANSDIDWSQSVAGIDRQLYCKYGLTESEIAFIEEKLRAME